MLAREVPDQPAFEPGPLTPSSLAASLVSHGLLEPTAALRSGFAITDISRRHTCFQVQLSDGSGFVVKQGHTPEKARALAHEAAVYRLLHSAASPPDLPELLFYDPGEHILAVRLIPGAEDLRVRSLRRPVSPPLARGMGKALARLHALPASDGGGRPVLPAIRPWIFSANRPHCSLLYSSSAAAIQCLKIIQHYAAAPVLEPVAALWRADCLIHGDARPDNWLVVPSRHGRLCLIDWELASFGDRAWDVAAVFAGFLTAWALSIPATLEIEPELLLPLARFPLERLQPGLAAFWLAYADPSVLPRASRYTGLRLFQTAYELCQGQPHLSPNVICLLQLGLNILQRPDDAMVHLLGLEANDEFH